MSFLTDPALYDYEPPPKVCGICFGAGDTPSSIFLCVQGVQMGTAVEGIDPNPPNGIFELTPSAPCLFEAVIGAHTFLYQPSPAQSTLQILSPDPQRSFIDQNPPTCRINFTNSLVNPAADPYFGGRAVVVPPLTCDLDNMEDLMSSLPWDPRTETYANPRPFSATETIFTLTRQLDHSNLRVKFVHT